jgi:hypothetical protein
VPLFIRTIALGWHEDEHHNNGSWSDGCVERFKRGIGSFRLNQCRALEHMPPKVSNGQQHLVPYRASD